MVTLTRNSPAESACFLAWYHRLSAALIVPYFHDPDEPNIAAGRALDVGLADRADASPTLHRSAINV